MLITPGAAINMKVGKPKSKRVPVRLRHKIEKASSSKQRKQRKEAKKNPQWRSRLKKDPGIPNMFPFKDKVLAEIEEGRRRKEEEARRRKDIAKAQRLGTSVSDEVVQKAVAEEAADEDEELLDPEAEMEEDGDEMEVRDESNPMAALLASAQARASAYTKGDADEDEADADEEDDEWDGIDESGASAPGQAQRKALPKQALADPIKAVSALMERMQKTQDGIQQLIDHYNIPALATAGTDVTSRFLVEVARKRGRLGRGGVPNLHSAALTVLGDLNDQRLQLPAAEDKKPAAATGKGEVQVVSSMAEPFRIEGLFGDNKKGGDAGGVEAMAIET